MNTPSPIPRSAAFMPLHCELRQGIGEPQAPHTLKRRERRAPIPTGLRPKAQGCEERATLGDVFDNSPQPQRGCVIPSRAHRHNPVGVDDFSGRFPRVARASQPWADGRSPVGANQTVRSRATPSPQRRIVSELDAEAAQMEAVRSLLPRFEAKIQRVLARVWGNGAEVSA